MIKCIVVLGPTATGKTKLGVQLADKFNGEIVSADSRQVYKGMDIGTGKDLKDFLVNNKQIPYHLIDIIEPTQTYHLYNYIKDAKFAITNIHKQQKLPIIVGGTALYINALLNNYQMPGGEPNYQLREKLQKLPKEQLLQKLKKIDSQLYERTDKTQKQRIIRAIEVAQTNNTSKQPSQLKLKPLIIAPYYPRKEVHNRIEQRLKQRLNEGMIEEVKSLQQNGVSWEKLQMFGLEYRYIAQYLQQKLTHEQMYEQLFCHIRRFCKAQDIWFRKMEREGKLIYWLPNGNQQKAENLVKLFLEEKQLPPLQIKLKDIFYGPRSN